MRMLDLFCGRFGWGRVFAERGWEVVGIDLVEPPEIPPNCKFLQRDILRTVFAYSFIKSFDFACASSPCEKFSIFGLPNFHPDPPYPAEGIELFNHTRRILEESGISYVMENVRSAERFVGKAVGRCGPFALWGNAVPPLLPQGIRKGISIGSGKAVRGMTGPEKREYRKQFAALQMGSKSAQRQAETAGWAKIPPELANTVATYAERLLEQAVIV